MEAVGLLLDRYIPLLFGLCMKYLKDVQKAEEHTQQICVKIIKEFQKPGFKVRYFKSWIYQVGKNHCLMYLRKNKHQTIPLENAGPQSTSPDGGPEEAQRKEQRLTLLEEALETLSGEQRRCIQLFYYEKMSYKEIADQENLSLKQIKSYLQNGKRNLKIYMEEKGNG